MILRQQEQYGWEFLFLGANMDAVETAQHIGINAGRAATYTSDSVGTRLNYDVVADAVCAMRQADAIPEDWADRIHKREGRGQ